MAIFFTSDEHYGHRNIIKFCKRPFIDLDDMREGLIARHNEVVKPGDHVYHLGDMFWRVLRWKEVRDILGRLNGAHYYIRGNHEEALDANVLELERFFVWFKERNMIEPDGGPKYGIVLDHFAGRVWHWSDRGSWQLYGHSHGELADDPNLLSMDVGVDANNWYSVSLDQVRARMEQKLKWMQRRIDSSKAKV